MASKNLVAIITGGSSGIGAAAARALASRNYAVSLAGRHTRRLAAVGEECAMLSGSHDKVLHTSGDVRDSEHLLSLVDRTVDKFGRLDLLVNNAGDNFELSNGGASDAMQLYDKTMHVNIRSVVELTEHCVEHLTKTKGNIVNVSSIAGTMAMLSPYYCMSKAAMNMFTKSTALRLAADGVRVNAVCPGAVETALTEQIRQSGAGHMVDAMIPVHPVGRLGHVNEVASLIVFLADNAKASFMTGNLVDVDGGCSANNPLHIAVIDGMARG